MAKKKKKQNSGSGSDPTSSTGKKGNAPKSTLKHVRKPMKQKQRRHYAQLIRDLKSTPITPSNRLDLNSPRSSRSKSKAMQSFKAIVDTVQDVAVVDLKPGCTAVEFASKDKVIKTRNEDDDLPTPALEFMPGPLPEESFFDSTSSEGTASSDDVFIVDMSGNKTGEPSGTTKPRKQPKSRVPKSSLPNPLDQKAATRSTPPRSSSRQNSRQIPKTNGKPSPSHQKNQQKPLNLPSTSHQLEEDEAKASSLQHPKPPQLSRIQQEDVAALSSGVSSEMETDFSESELMSADSGEEEEAENSNADKATVYFAPYNKKGYRVLHHTIPTHCMTVIHPHSVLPFHGQVKMSVIHGEVKVHGCVANSNTAPLELYSPKSTAALSIETPDTVFKLDKEDASGRTDLKEKLKQYFMSDRAEKMTEEVLGMIQEHGVSVIVVESHWSDRTDYVTSFPTYSELFQRPFYKRKWNSSEEALDIGFIPIKPNTNTKILTTPPFYHTVTEPIMQALRQSGPGRPPIVLVCGWKNVGKSTLVRYIINSMLNSTNAVCMLDCDVGQTEFNPPTMLSITKVTQPLLGPPFTHEVKPERMCFFGESSPGSSPSVYLGAIKYLYQYYVHHLQDMPLIVNCMGWMKGLGLSLLIDTMRLIEPSHIIQLLPTPEPKKPPILDKHYIQQAQGWSRDGISGLVKKGEWNPEYMLVHTPWSAIEDGKYKAANRRELSLLGYLSQLMPPKLKFLDPQATFDPLPAVKPYSVPWSSFAVHVCNADVPASQLMYALNASVVGLCIADKRQMVSLDSDDAEHLPKVFKSAPVCECLGLGIIRGIDPVGKMFYILSHLPETTLKDVNTLLKGSLALPKFVLQQGQRKGMVPYVTTEFPHDVTGTGSIKVKYMKPQPKK